MSESNKNFEELNCEKFVDKVMSCVCSIWLTSDQIYDVYRLKYKSKFNNAVFDDLEVTLNCLFHDGDILREDNPEFGTRYSTSGTAHNARYNNIVPITRKLAGV